MTYKACETTKGFDLRLAMFTIWKKTGNSTSRTYYGLMKVDYDASGKIELHFASREKITLAGRNLGELRNALVKHEVIDIWEANRSEELPGDACVVERVIFT